MIAALLLAAVVPDPSSHFVGDWICVSAFTDEPLEINLSVRTEGDVTKAAISETNDQRLPNGSIKSVGKAETIKKIHEWEKRSEIMADAQQHFFVKNSVGGVDFKMLWDKDDGITVNLWQYFDDRSPSKLMGALMCAENTK